MNDNIFGKGAESGGKVSRVELKPISADDGKAVDLSNDTGAQGAANGANRIIDIGDLKWKTEAWKEEAARNFLLEKHIFTEGVNKEAQVAISAFKHLRTRIMLKMDDIGVNTLMVVGANQNVGKTLMSINLAIALARQPDKQVILVDLDLRSPSMHQIFDFVPKGDIVDVAEGRLKLSDVLFDSGVSGLKILPGTTSYNHSAEIIMSSKMRELFNALKHLKDTIVVYDTPPILGCDDVATMAPHMDSCLFVVREDETSRPELEQALRILDKRVNMLGVTINQSSEGKFSSYYYGGQVQEELAENEKRHRDAWYGIGALAIVCVCVGIWWFNQTPSSELSNMTTLSNVATDDKPSNTPLHSGNDAIAIDTTAENANTAESLLSGDTNAVSVPSTIDSRKETHTPGEKNTPAGDETVGWPEQANLEQPADSTQTPASSSLTRTGAATQLRSTEWFAGLAPDRFTLQLISLTKEASSRAFIQSRHLEDEAAYFAVRNDDQKTWYTITYGLYESHESAESASKSLPDSINDLEPMVRNTGRIQQLMLR